MGNSVENKLIWVLSVILFLTLQPACRTLKKDMRSESGKSESNRERVDLSKTAENKDVDRNIFEETEIVIKFSDPIIRVGNPPPSGDIGDSPVINVPDAPIDRLIERISQLTIKVKSEQNEHEISSKIQENDLKEKIQSNQQNKTKSTSKQTDSTIGANIPWYAWIIVALAMIGIVWVILKKL